jgi:hypothetical protein
MRLINTAEEVGGEHAIPVEAAIESAVRVKARYAKIR